MRSVDSMSHHTEDYRRDIITSFITVANGNVCNGEGHRGWRGRLLCRCLKSCGCALCWFQHVPLTTHQNLPACITIAGSSFRVFRFATQWAPFVAVKSMLKFSTTLRTGTRWSGDLQREPRSRFRHQRPHSFLVPTAPPRNDEKSRQHQARRLILIMWVFTIEVICLNIEREFFRLHPEPHLRHPNLDKSL